MPGPSYGFRHQAISPGTKSPGRGSWVEPQSVLLDIYSDSLPQKGTADFCSHSTHSTSCCQRHLQTPLLVSNNPAFSFCYCLLFCVLHITRSCLRKTSHGHSPQWLAQRFTIPTPCYCNESSTKTTFSIRILIFPLSKHIFELLGEPLLPYSGTKRILNILEIKIAPLFPFTSRLSQHTKLTSNPNSLHLP